MPRRASITYKGDAKTLKKELRPQVKEVLKEVVEDWHEKTLPSHFTDTGRRRYGYRARTANYRNRKRRVKRHGRPLEYSGDMKRMATRQVRISGTAKSARATFQTPWYATKAFRGFDTYADEMTAVTQGEAKKMASSVRQKVSQRLKNKQKNAKGRKR